MPAVHPQVQVMLDALAKANVPPVESLEPPAARAQMEAMVKARNVPPIPVAKVEDRTITGPGGPLKIRLYWPEAKGPVPAIVYYHGGGHVIGSLDTHDTTSRVLCAGAGALVCSVDYRMGPEDRFPAAVDDSFFALQWVHKEAKSLGVDPTRLGVAGDSAGGNLAAVVALMARDAGGPALKMQGLFYPVTDYTLSGGSYETYATGYGILTRDAMRWFRRHYLRNDADANDWRASPLKANSLAGVAPTVLVTAECDVLYDDGKRYAAALKAAGVPVDYRDFAGMIHGFLPNAPMLDGAAEAQKYIVAAFKKAFA